MSEQGKVVLVDMDGVMADFDSAALVHIPHTERVPRRNFYVAQDYPTHTQPTIEATYHSPGFFENLELMPGLIEAWQAMIENGYEPRVASAPVTGNSTAIEEKIKWLDRVMVPEFGPAVVERAIIDKNKWKYGGLALIDDRPDVPRGIDGSNDAKWQHILFGWPHFDRVPMATAAFRLLSWHDVDGLLTTLESIQRFKG